MLLQYPLARLVQCTVLTVFKSRSQTIVGTVELTRFRGQFIALAIMKCFSKHSASNRILKARAVRSAW